MIAVRVWISSFSAGEVCEASRLCSSNAVENRTVFSLVKACKLSHNDPERDLQRKERGGFEMRGEVLVDKVSNATGSLIVG